ncbi:MAG: hypothetical protein AB1896_05940 [Thermodesulfobacteriota bacterium]
MKAAKTSVILWTLFLAAALALAPGDLVRAGDQWERVQGHPYKKKAPEGYCNCLFASREIGKDHESEVVLKEVFTRPEPVYARCYFPGRVDEIPPEDFWHEIWIDGRPVRRTVFEEAPVPGADQVQIWITEDEYAQDMAALEPGRHEVVLWVMVNVRQGNPDLPEDQKDIWTTVRLAKGEFIYIVP